jgi:hypothetical protein
MHGKHSIDRVDGSHESLVNLRLSDAGSCMLAVEAKSSMLWQSMVDKVVAASCNDKLVRVLPAGKTPDDNKICQNCKNHSS